jgi:hypothetical protein
VGGGKVWRYVTSAPLTFSWLTVLLATTIYQHSVSTAERWRGSYWTIQEATASPRLIRARDIGVSYFVIGIVGVLTYRIARPWRWSYLAIALAVVGIPLIVRPDFTPLGHLTPDRVGLLSADPWPRSSGCRSRAG